MPNTVRLHRVLATTPESLSGVPRSRRAREVATAQRVYLYGVSLEPKVGGTFKMSFRNFTTGKSHSFGGEYVQLVPTNVALHRHIRRSNLATIQVTVVLKKVSVGTEIDIEQEGVPDVIPPEACDLGWQESLRNLARLVEPEINQ